MKYNSVFIVFCMSIKTHKSIWRLALGQHIHILSKVVTHSCVCPQGELSQPRLVDADYAVDLIQL